MAKALLKHDHDVLDELQAVVRDYLRDSTGPNPEFDFTIGWCRDYEALFRGEFDKQSDIFSLASRSLASGRVILSGRAGTGKTVILRRLAAHFLQRGSVTVLLDLRKWSPFHYEEWNACSESTVERMNYLFSSLGLPRFTVRILDALPPGVPRLLFVDGLNEVTHETAQAIIHVLDDFVRYAVNTGVVVADRLARRELTEQNRWKLATILPLDQHQVVRLLQKSGRSETPTSSTKTLLTTPYFLDSVLHSGSLEFSDYFLRHVGLTRQEIDSTADAAYDMYRASQSRTFSSGPFRQATGDAIWNKLTSTGALHTTGTSAYFHHHLLHDFLVSKYLAKRENLWTPDVFNVATFSASSFETLSMALGQLPGVESADHFVQQIYDWNLYGAAYAVTEGRYRGAARISDEMTIVILAMLTERRWDLIRATRTRAEDALSIFPSDKAVWFLKAASMDILLEYIRQIDPTSMWFRQWRSLFIINDDAAIKETEPRIIKEPNSLLGWTFANVLKRFALPEDWQRTLRDYMNEERATIRWRIVHVLGAFPTQDNATCLLAHLQHDEDRWVRYGAVRSLVELTAKGEHELRDNVFKELAGIADSLAQDHATIKEFESAIFIDVKQAPRDWVPSLAAVIERLYYNEPSFESRQHWKEIAYRLKAEYGTG